jgi:hypothetical protein
MDNSSIDTGYSGNPLSFAAYQPEQSVEPFLYVADSARFSKVRASDGSRFNVGIVPPAGPPSANLSPVPLYSLISNFDSYSSWTAGGTASSVGGFNRVASGATVAAILYDSGTTGWACVTFTTSSPNPGAFNKGAQIEVDSEFSYVTNMIPAASDVTTTIAAIAYDSGTTGACCIVLASNTSNLQRDAMVQLNSEYVRVLSVSVGEDNSVSFRCSTTGTHAAAETVTFVDCSRMYFASNHTAGASVAGLATEFTVATGTGYITYTPGSAIDLSQISGRPLTVNDWMHISLWPAALSSAVTQALLLLDVDSVTNNFTKNYYYIDITNILNSVANAGDPQNAAAQLSGITSATTLLQIAQIQQDIDAANANGETALAASLQAALSQIEGANLYTGVTQWLEVAFPLSSLVRVGTDETVSLAGVKALRVQFTTTTSVVIGADSWWAGGTYGPNAPESINPENPIKYCFRYRSTITGAQSTWSPLNRGGSFPERQGMTITGKCSTDSQVDTVDIARVGASVNGTPLFLSSIPNSGSTWSFTDNYADAQLGDPIEPGDNQPWPIQQSPITGTCSVVGTSVFSTSVSIPTNLCEGTIVLVGGIATVIRGLPTANAFQVEDNLDTGTGVQLQINSPTTFGNALPYMVGPFDECFFAMGDPLNPTRIYNTNRKNPDTAKTSNYVDLPTTNAGLGVGIYNGYVVAMTSEEFIIGTTTGNTTNPYAFSTTSVGCGLLAPWAFTVGPGIFFWTRNGIAITDLGAAKSISNEDLYPYLPHEGLAGISVNGYLPPPMNVQPRLAYAKNGWLYVDFVDTGGNYRGLAFDTTKPGWWFDEYTPGAHLHYQDEQDDALVLVGCIDGTIRNLSTAGGELVGSHIRLGANNFGDIRSLKQVVDLALNVNGVVNVSILANSWTIPVFSSTLSGNTGTVGILPISAGYDPTKLYLDFALDLSWAWFNQQIVEYDLGYLQNPMLAVDFVANPTTFGFEGYGHVREAVLNTVALAAMTANLVIKCEFPGTITIPVSIAGGASRQYIPIPPNKGMLYEWSLQGNGTDLGMFSCDAHVKGWTEENYRTVNPFLE